MPFVFSLFIFLLSLPATALAAEPLRFRLVAGECIDGQKKGINFNYFGQCGQFKKIKQSERTRSDADLRGSSTSYFTFQRFDGRKFQINHARWTMATISGSDFSDSSFQEAEITGIFARNSRLRRANFSRAILNGARFYFSDFHSAIFLDAKLHGAVLIESNFENADFRGTDLSLAQFQVSRLEGALFDERTKLPFSEADAIRRGMKKVSR